MSSRVVVSSVAALAIVLVATAAAGPAQAPAPPTTSGRTAAPVDRNAERAEATLASIEQHFSTRDGRFHEVFPSTGDAYSTLWPLTQTILGMLFVSQLRDRPLPTDAPDYFEPYWDTTTSPPGYLAAMFESSGSGRKFFDDNAWTGLDLVETYRSNGDSAALTRAVQIFNFTVSGWDDAPTDPDPGGVWWAQQNPNPRFAHRNTISTASSAELALRLYEATGRIDTHYLDWATRMYAWVDTYLRGSNGLYGDHVDLAGQVDPGQLTYNQGTMIGAAVLLYRSSGNGEYLARARATAETSLDVFGPDYNQQPAYNAVFFRNLLLLEADTRDGHYRAAMQAYADTVWDTLHDPATGLFNFANGRSRSVEPHRLLDQAAMLQIYALLTLGPDAADVTI